MKEEPQLGRWKLLHVPSGVRYIAENPEHSCQGEGTFSYRAGKRKCHTSCLPERDLRGHESKMEVDLSSTLSSPYSTCCRVSMNLQGRRFRKCERLYI